MKKIEIINVTKSYKKIDILKQVSYCFESGKCYLIIGANGAGKSTLLKLITKMIYPIQGEIKLYDLKIGYVPDKLTLPLNITVNLFLKTITNLKNGNIMNTIMLMKYFDLYENKNKYLNQLSKGMLQKILIIQAFIGEPDVLIFDEALNGLDIVMQKKLIELIGKEKNKDKIIIITSHYPNYYDDVIDVKVKLENGKIN